MAPRGIIMRIFLPDDGISKQKTLSFALTFTEVIANTLKISKPNRQTVDKLNHGNPKLTVMGDLLHQTKGST